MIYVISSLVVGVFLMLLDVAIDRAYEKCLIAGKYFSKNLLILYTT